MPSASTFTIADWGIIESLEWLSASGRRLSAIAVFKERVPPMSSRRRIPSNSYIERTFEIMASAASAPHLNMGTRLSPWLLRTGQSMLSRLRHARLAAIHPLRIASTTQSG
jgi:hypothetical protein